MEAKAWRRRSPFDLGPRRLLSGRRFLLSPDNKYFAEYRLPPAQDGSWTVEGLPGVTLTAETRKAALTAARTAIATVLEVDWESFDLEG